MNSGLIVAAAAELDPLHGATLAARSARCRPTPRSRCPSSREGALVTEREAWEFDEPLAREDLARQFGVRSLDGLGIGADDAPAVGAAGALLRYLRELQPAGLPQLARPIIERPGGVMPLDEMTRRNLELVESLRGGGAKARCSSVLDRTERRWARDCCASGFSRRSPIARRSMRDSTRWRRWSPTLVAREALRDALDGVRDVERLGGKAAAGRATPRELRALGDSLCRAARRRRSACSGIAGDRGRLARNPLRAVGRLRGVASAICATRSSSGRRSRSATTRRSRRASIAELDELRDLRDGGKDAIARIQAEERARTGIASLKVGFNKVFGYFIEITNANLHLVPPDYQRRQTLTSRRAIRHAGAQGVRREGAHRGRAHRDARA